MKISSLILFVVISLQLSAQQVISPLLQSSVQDLSSREMLDVIVYLAPVFCVSTFQEQAKLNEWTREERIYFLQKQLKQHAQKSQSELLKEFSEDPNIEVLQQFWIVNAVHLRIPASYLYYLQDFPEIRYMDSNQPRYRSEQPIKVEKSKKSSGGIEAGIAAINAPALWQMGYTGRNLIFLSMDTGVFPEHPAIREQYLGNYRPVNEVWYGMRSDIPTDHASSSHGTHTTGTVLGLEKQNNDTIGIAYNAHWIATDPVASDNSEVLAPTEFLNVYEWVLNPDGNMETSHDVPHVINNSWGYDYDMALEFDACNLEEASVYEMIEAADIISPFSAGNSGPEASTIGFPAMMAFSEWNIFSVGAVNGNTDEYPIADFSSRGPGLCVEEEGALKIKPEVCAPGVSVRSASGQNEYSLLSGTSMACPHVSGAFLLLKEAFPYLNAAILKQALYLTAVDLGETGEDNTYGRGMIDVLAAFNYLAETYSPVPPVTDAFDLSLEIIQFSNQLVCPDNATVNPIIQFTNNGQEEITNIDYCYRFNQNDTACMNWNGSLMSGEQITIELDEILLNSGNNQLHVWANLPDVEREFSVFNNSDVETTFLLNEGQVPYLQEFNSDSLISDWFISNTDGLTTWNLLPAPVYDTLNLALAMQFYDYFPRNAQKDSLITPMFQLPQTSEKINLSFDIAYKKRMEYIYKDSLYVALSTDCGENFSEQLYANGGETMATVEGNSGNVFFIPQSVQDWDTVNIDISEYNGQTVIIALIGKNDRGNNLYIDNFRIYTGNADDVQVEKDIDVEVFPNPAKDFIQIRHNLNETIQYEILGLNSGEIKSGFLSTRNAQINLHNLNSGVYLLRLHTLEKVLNFKLIVL
jgi:subtilisin family serine protease